MTFSHHSSFHVLVQVIALCSKLCHLKNEDVIQFDVLTVKGRNKDGTKYEMDKEKEERR
jgi:hemerythrin-like domain-containing protein